MLVADVFVYLNSFNSTKVLLEELNGCSGTIELCRKDQVDLGVWEIRKKKVLE